MLAAAHAFSSHQHHLHLSRRGSYTAPPPSTSAPIEPHHNTLPPTRSGKPAPCLTQTRHRSAIISVKCLHQNRASVLRQAYLSHQKETSIEQLNVELEAAKMAESYAHCLLEEWKTRVEELEMRFEEANKLERSVSESLEYVQKQLEGSNDLLQLLKRSIENSMNAFESSKVEDVNGKLKEDENKEKDEPVEVEFKMWESCLEHDFFNTCAIILSALVAKWNRVEMPLLKMPNLPFQVGDLVESRCFQLGFRGAWFRCKIRAIGKKGDTMSYQLEYFDYPDQKLSWIKVYQKPSHISKSKGFHRELMVRPSFPAIHKESEKVDMNTISEVIVIVDNEWKVGDLVDWKADGCYWSGKVTKILENGKVQIDLLPPPLGEGLFYEALSKELRPSLDWCPEKGWTVSMPMDDGCRRPCARVMNPANSDGAAKVGQLTDGSMERKKQCNTAGNGMENGVSDNIFGRTCFSDSVSNPSIMDKSIENWERATMNSGYNDEYPAKMRSNRSLCLNSMSSNTIEASILDLEELVNRIKWLRNVLNLGLPLPGTESPSWEFLQHHAPCK
ncbi:Agenet-like domain [Sesbania bispinosa]|nr:Agenet-like domain [Sesbania bispinosa]